MKKYKVDYIDKSGDLCHVWVNADSKQEAELEVGRSWWDIVRIIQITEIK